MSNGVVYRRVPPLDPALVAAARGCRVSDLHEALGPIKGRMATMSERMRPLALDVRMAGVAVTVRPAPGDNLMLHRALRLAERDQVLVVAAGAEAGAQWGYLAALYAERIGLAGVVVHGTIRDVDSLAERRYPVWSTAISPAHPEKKGPGAVNIPVVCDGVTVRPGDLIVGDGDGVIVVPREDAAVTIQCARDRAAAERLMEQRIAAGESLWDLHDIGNTYDRLAVPEHDRVWDAH